MQTSLKLLEFRITKLRDQDAYELFYKRIYPELRQFLRARLNSQETAEDLAHEALIEVWRAIFVKKEEVRSLRGLLYTVAKHNLFHYYRKHAQEPIYIDEYFENTVSSESFLSCMEVSADMEMVRDALNKLSKDYKEVIVLRYLNEFEYQEIAALMGKSQGAIRVLLHRALRELRKQLRD